MRRVISLWLPRFATDRWERRHPQPDDAWQARPLALVRQDHGCLLVAAVNPAAERCGIIPGLPLADARALVPRLRTADCDPRGDAEGLASLADWCRRYTPWTAVDGSGAEAGGGGLVLDVTGCAHLFGGEQALVADMVRRLKRFGFDCRAALADTLGAAWAVARFAATEARPHVVVPPGTVRAALAELPPAALRLTADQAELLDRLGLRRIEDLYTIPPAALAPRFGPAVTRRLRQALGVGTLGAEPEPVSPRLPVPSYLVRQVFAEPIVTPEDIARALERLLAALCRRLEAEHLGARRIGLTLYRVDGTLRHARLGTSRPTREPTHLKRLFAPHLDNIDPGFGIEVMTLAASTIEPLSALQMVLAGDRQRADGDLAALVDRLDNRPGVASVFRLAPRESHVPERATALVPALEEVRDVPWPSGRSRPLRLLTRPEPIEAMALLPDHPPVQFRWRRLLHRVARAEGPERIVAEWWLPDPAAAREPPRDYFRIEDGDGRRYWVYSTDGRWYLHGLFA